MKYTMERWYMVSTQRFSVRKYKEGPTQEDIEHLSDVAKTLSTSGVHIVLGKNADVFSPIILWYGKIKGASDYAVFMLDKDADKRMLGYMGEAFILECCALGLGTCWLGASYKKNLVNELTKHSENEKIECITPIGVPDEPYFGRPRKSLDKLTGLTQSELIALPEWQQRAIECARIAPSAVNAQPWRFIISDNSITIRRIANNYGYGFVDCGIAMLHIELGASHCGVAGSWKLDSDDAVFTLQQ